MFHLCRFRRNLLSTPLLIFYHLLSTFTGCLFLFQLVHQSCHPAVTGRAKVKEQKRVYLKTEPGGGPTSRVCHG